MLALRSMAFFGSFAVGRSDQEPEETLRKSAGLRRAPFHGFSAVESAQDSEETVRENAGLRRAPSTVFSIFCRRSQRPKVRGNPEGKMLASSAVCSTVCFDFLPWVGAPRSPKEP